MDTTLVSPNRLLPNREAAAYLGVAPNTLDVWRCAKRYAIPYVKVGRKVMYRVAELDAWLESRTVGGAEGDD